MTDSTPLKFEFDDTTPSSLAEFTASNTVPVVNGGTGVSSLAALGAALQGYDVSAKSLSALNIVAVNLSATNLSATNIIASTEVCSLTFASPGDSDSLYFKRDTGATYPNLIKARSGALTIMAENLIALRSKAGELYARFYPNGACELNYDDSIKLETHNAGVLVTGGVSATNVSSTYIYTETGVSAASVSATTITVDGNHTPMPIPAPWGYAQCMTAGTPNDVEQNIGIGCTVATSISSSDDFVWDDTNKRFDIVKTGTYEFTVNAVLMVDATTTITLQLYSTYPGSSKLTADTRVHSSIDADIVSLTYVGQFIGGAYAYATTTDDGGTDVTIQPGTTLTIKRLK